MRRILTSLVLVASAYSFAQVGINVGDTGLPNIVDDAVFQVANKQGENKGVLLPSVSLTSKIDQVTTSNGTVTKGLMVWNDGTKGLTPAGYYYWSGKEWVLTGNVDSSKSYKKVESITGGVTQYSSSADTGLLVNNTGAKVTIDLSSSEIVGNEVCVFQKNGGGINFSKSNLKGQAITFGNNTGACYIWDGSNWLGIFSF